jgi:hypothetical protein
MEYKEKFFFGLTVRQLVCTAACLAITIPTGIFGGKILPSDIVQWIVILEAIPFAAFGFISFDGQPVEKVFFKAFKYYISPQKDIIYYKPEIYAWQEEFTRLMLKSDHMIEKLERKIFKRAVKEVKKRNKRTKQNIGDESHGND